MGELRLWGRSSNRQPGVRHQKCPAQDHDVARQSGHEIVLEESSACQPRCSRRPDRDIPLPIPLGPLKPRSRSTLMTRVKSTIPAPMGVLTQLSVSPALLGMF